MDAWVSGNQVSLWVKDADGRNHFFRDTYFFPIHVRTIGHRGERFFSACIERGIFSEPRGTTRKDVWTGKELFLYRVRVLDPGGFRKILRIAERYSDDIEYFDTDLTPIQHYFLEKNLYPLATIEINEPFSDSSEKKEYPPVYRDRTTHLHINVLSDRLSKDHSGLPPFRALLLSTPGGRFLPLGERNPLHIILSDSEELVSPKDPEGILRFLNRVLRDQDPDLIFTHSGDEMLFPTLFSWSAELGLRLLLDRDPIRTVRKNRVRKRTFFTYGRAIAKTTPFPLFGRLHIDRGVSFYYLESELEGIFEMSRFSRLSIQKLARSSPGSAMSAMEDETAMDMGYAIPRVKGMAPDIKSLSELLKSDQGGLSFRPPVGIFENVVELDFRSLYPNLMRVHNISGETVNCSCCRNTPEAKPVPATLYHTCGRRMVIVGKTISLLLDRRDELKEILKDPNLSESERRSNELRASALKWSLVTSFGYTGYKHAKYGKREAHESITAWGRYSLQTAKEIAEDQGYAFLHGLTDSLWLLGDTDLEKVLELCRKISQKVRVSLQYETTYSYIVFPASKIREDISVATRYFAREISGEMKVRGIMLRRRDTPPFIKEFQEGLLEIFSEKNNIREVVRNFSQFQKMYHEFEETLLSGSVPKEKLIIRKYISRSFSDYKANNASRIVLGQLVGENMDLVGGERIEYIVKDSRNADPNQRYEAYHRFSGKVDFLFYKKLLEEAFWELLEPFFGREESLFQTHQFRGSLFGK